MVNSGMVDDELVANNGTIDSSSSSEPFGLAPISSNSLAADYQSALPCQTDATEPLKASFFCSVPLAKVQTILTTYTKTPHIPPIKPKTQRKVLCLYCERSFRNDTLREKHVERSHSPKQFRRVSLRQHQKNHFTSTPCVYCDKLNQTNHTLDELFQHLLAKHQSKYFACKLCNERYLNRIQFIDHNAEMHQFNGDVAPEETGKKARKRLKGAKVVVKRSKRLQAKVAEPEASKKITKKDGKLKAEVETSPEKEKQSNPYPEFDHFYQVKKITDHSIDNLKISSLTFDDVFDKAFFNRIRCNIQENLANHIDGKLFKNEESETRISNFEKTSTITSSSVINPTVNPPDNVLPTENYGCELSLNAATPSSSLLSSQFGEDLEAQIEYGAKPSKKKPQIHYKYFTRRKYQAIIMEQKENRDLSKLDMWTQYAVKNRQQKIIDDKKSAKEILDWCSGDEYRNKMGREELNRILDRRGPFEDLREEVSKMAALDARNSGEVDVQNEICELLNDILTNLCDERSDALVEERFGGGNEAISMGKVGEDGEIPVYLNLRRRTSSLEKESLEIDKSDKIALICSSQETENFELPTNTVRGRNEKVELTGEWARSRIYVCAACGLKLANMKQLLEHKNTVHQYVWVQHYEFVGNQSELYKHLSIPTLGKVGVLENGGGSRLWKRSDARMCTKCNKQCNSLSELHRHILECGGDWTWMLARKKCKYRPYGSKSRRRRRGLVKRIYVQKTEPGEKKVHKKPFDGPRPKPSDAETIQRMLANLPAKRATRKLISLKDGFPPRNSSKIAKNPPAKLKCGKLIHDRKSNDKKSAPQQQQHKINHRRSLRSLNKVLATRILDTNAKLIAKRKYKKKLTNEQNAPLSAEKPKRSSPRLDKKAASGSDTKTVRNVIEKMNIKRFFPVKKKAPTIAKKNTEADDKSKVSKRKMLDEKKVAVVKKAKLAEESLVQKVKLRKRKAKTVQQLDETKSEAETSDSRIKLRNRFKNVVMKQMKKLKKEKQKDCPKIENFLENYTKEPIENKVEIIDSEVPISIEVHSNTVESNPFSPSAQKRKLRKPGKGLNDCIAMLTNKLTTKTEVFDAKPPTDEKINSDLILKVPLFNEHFCLKQSEETTQVSKKTDEIVQENLQKISENVNESFWTCLMHKNGVKTAKKAKTAKTKRTKKPQKQANLNNFIIAPEQPAKIEIKAAKNPLDSDDEIPLSIFLKDESSKMGEIPTGGNVDELVASPKSADLCTNTAIFPNEDEVFDETKLSIFEFDDNEEEIAIISKNPMEIKENVNGKRKTKTKTIHDEALAELTDNERNRESIVEEFTKPMLVKRRISKKLSPKKNVASEQNEVEGDDDEVIEEEGTPKELRRSGRTSKKIIYNEIDLLDPLIDELDSKMKKEIENIQIVDLVQLKGDYANIATSRSQKCDNAAMEEAKLNSDELFDLLKATPSENISLSKPSNSFLNNFNDLSDDDNATVLNQTEMEDELIELVALPIEEIVEEIEVSKAKKGRKRASKAKRQSDKMSECSSSEVTVEDDLETVLKAPEVIKANYCEICSKSFCRLEGLVKHKRTLTHISKLSELEAKEAEAKKAQDELEEVPMDLESEIITKLIVDDVNTNSLGNMVESKPDTPFFSQSVNTASLKLADIINDVLNKPVQRREMQPELKQRCRSLGERKSFEQDQNLTVTDKYCFEPQITNTAQKQISLLENIIENRLDYNKVEDEIKMPEMNRTKEDFLRPMQFEEISEDSNQKARRLNGDEQLFLECCSLLKSGSEVASFQKKTQSFNLGTVSLLETQNNWFESKYNGDSNSILVSNFNNESSETIRSNWNNSNSGRNSDFDSRSFTFADFANDKEKLVSTFDDVIAKKLFKSDILEGSKLVETKKSDDLSDASTTDSRKMLTKGALKVFEGLKVSIPTDDLNLKNLLSAKKAPKQQEEEPIIHKITTPSLLSSKSHDIYDFEETIDNSDVFSKPFAFRSKSEQKEIEDEEEDSLSTSSSDVLPPTNPDENITKKKCMIMGRIFKNAAKSKLDEDIRNIPIVDNAKLVEDFVRNCAEPEQAAPKMSEEEMDRVFDALLGTNEPKKAVSSRKKGANRPKKRFVSDVLSSDQSDDEFELRKNAKKRAKRRSGKPEDNCINLEQEMKECIGVAGRKSQRKCTSGKQNVLIEYWSSDDSAFEALLLETKQLSSAEAGKNGDGVEKVAVLVREAVEKPKVEKAGKARRNKRAAPNPLYHWSSSSEDETGDLIEIKPIRDEIDDEDRPVQHGWIVGDSPKKLVTMLAQAKGKKCEGDGVKELGRKHNRTNAMFS